MSERTASLRRLAVLGRPALLIGGLLVSGWALRGLPLHDLAIRSGGLGLVSFVTLGAIACAVGVPRQVVAFAAGYTQGLWAGGILALAAQLAGCLADVGWARIVARSWVQAHLRGAFGARLRRLDRFLTCHTFTATVMLRLLPVGSNMLLNLLAGALGLRIPAFIAASAIGYLPQTIVFVLLGAGIRLGRATELALAGAMFAGSTGLGCLLLRRARAEGAVAEISVKVQNHVPVLPEPR